jgi:hypothetical protein
MDFSGALPGSGVFIMISCDPWMRWDTGPGHVERTTSIQYSILRTSIHVLFRTVSSEILDRDLLFIVCAGGAVFSVVSPFLLDPFLWVD